MPLASFIDLGGGCLHSARDGGVGQAGQAYRRIASFTQRATELGTSHSIVSSAFVPQVGSVAVMGCSVGRGLGSMLSTLTWIRPGWCPLSCRQSTIDWRTVRAICRAGARLEVAMSTLTWVSARPVGPGRWVTVILSEPATVAVSGPGPGGCCLVEIGRAHV